LDGKHGQSGKQERKHGTNQDTREHNRFNNAHLPDFGFVCKGGQERKCRQDGRSNSESLSSGSRRVAQGIKSIRSITDAFGKFSHLGNTTGIVSDRAIGIHGKSDSKSTEHADGGHGDTVLADQGVAAKDSGHDNQHGKDSRDHSNTETLDNDRGRSSDSSLGNGSDWPEGVAGKELCDLSNEYTCGKANANACKDLPTVVGAILKDESANEGAKANHKGARDNGSLVQGKHELLLRSTILGSNGKVSNYCGNDTTTSNPQG
jgi:hypothetical protein